MKFEISKRDLVKAVLKKAATAYKENIKIKSIKYTFEDEPEKEHTYEKEISKKVVSEKGSKRNFQNIISKLESQKSRYSDAYIEFYLNNDTSLFYTEYGKTKERRNPLSWHELAVLNGDSTEMKMYAKDMLYMRKGIKGTTVSSGKFHTIKSGLRPFFNPVITLYYDKVIASAGYRFRNEIRNNPSQDVIVRMLTFAGEQMKQMYKNWFDTRGSGSWLPNKPSTARRKGANTPMIDSGSLREEGLQYRIVIRKSRYKWTGGEKVIDSQYGDYERSRINK